MVQLSRVYQFSLDSSRVLSWYRLYKTLDFNVVYFQCHLFLERSTNAGCDTLIPLAPNVFSCGHTNADAMKARGGARGPSWDPKVIDYCASWVKPFSFILPVRSRIIQLVILKKKFMSVIPKAETRYFCKYFAANRFKWIYFVMLIFKFCTNAIKSIFRNEFNLILKQNCFFIFRNLWRLLIKRLIRRE